MNIWTEWYDKLIDFAKQKLPIVFWFFISSAILIFAPNDYLRIIHLDNLANYIAPVSGIIFLLSGVLICINIISSGKQFYQKRSERKIDLTLKRKLLNQLEESYNIKELESGFKSQQDCIAWASKTAPLLKFNDQYYRIFIENCYTLYHEGISANLGGSLLNTMISQLEMAIHDLRQEIDHLESK